MKVFTTYIFSVLMVLAELSSAQSFITRVSATTIGRDDILQIEYVADNVEMDDFVLPNFSNWTVVSGPNLSSSRMQNGNLVKQETVYSVLVQPAGTGSLLVPGATANINNKLQKSNAVAVVVKNIAHFGNAKPPVQAPQSSIFDQPPFEDELPANQYLKKGEKAIDKIKNNILVRLEVSKQTCYAGEPILAVYKLCTRLKSKSKVVKQPTFSGCTVVELTGDEQDQHVEKLNGREYNVFVIRKVQLVPLQAGKLELPVTSVENRVSFYDASQLNYRDLYYSQPALPAEEQLVTLQNKPVTVEVKPLPPYPAITNTEFSGAIGKFDVAVSAGEELFTTSNTNHLLFTVQGEGNLQQVKAPDVQWQQGIEAFEPAEQTEDDKTNFPTKTRKVFSFPFVTDKKGSYSIPPLAFTYFDAEAGRYVTKTTNRFTLNVAAGRKTFLGAITKVTDAEGFQSRLYILLGAAFIAVLIGLVWFNGKPKPKAAPAAAIPVKEENPEEKKRDASDFLFNIRELQPGLDSSFFYKLLHKNLQSYFQNKFGFEVSELPNYIEQHPASASSLLTFKILLDDCNVGMYTPVFTIEEAMQHRLQAIEILTKLEAE